MLNSVVLSCFAFAARCSVLGTPTEEIWPGYTQLPAYNPNFPRYRPGQLAQHVPGLSPEGLDLLSVRPAAGTGPARGWSFS